jgi:hypothetical protein
MKRKFPWTKKWETRLAQIVKRFGEERTIEMVPSAKIAPRARPKIDKDARMENAAEYIARVDSLEKEFKSKGSGRAKADALKAVFDEDEDEKMRKNSGRKRHPFSLKSATEKYSREKARCSKA